MYFQKRSSPSIPRNVVIPRRPSVPIQQPNIPNLSLKDSQKIVSQPNIPNLSLNQTTNIPQQPNIPNLSLNDSQNIPQQPNTQNLSLKETKAKKISNNNNNNTEVSLKTIQSPPPEPEPPVEILGTISLFDGPDDINPSDGSRGKTSWDIVGGFTPLSYIGFKLGPYTRIRNGRIWSLDSTEEYVFGLNTNWDIIKYFETHDLNITSDGIGRTGTFNYGNGWQHDVVGFYLDIPSNFLTNGNIVVDYEYTTNSNNKNTIGFWDNIVAPNGSLDFSVDKYAMGTWDSNIPRTYITSKITANTIITQKTTTTNVVYNRRMVFV